MKNTIIMMVLVITSLFGCSQWGESCDSDEDCVTGLMCGSCDLDGGKVCMDYDRDQTACVGTYGDGVCGWNGEASYVLERLCEKACINYYSNPTISDENCEGILINGGELFNCEPCKDYLTKFETKQVFNVDDACTDLSIESFEKGIEIFNKSVGFEALGLKYGLKIENYKKDVKISDGVSMIVCPKNVDEYGLLKGHLGIFYHGDIAVDLSKVPGHGDVLLSVFLHELGHFAGANHVDDKKSVMYPTISDKFVLEYTEQDKNAMVNYF